MPPELLESCCTTCRGTVLTAIGGPNFGCAACALDAPCGDLDSTSGAFWPYCAPVAPEAVN